MNNPLISVIIPVYNAAPYLRRCLDSVRQQSYTNIEIIVVDDGSKDESGKICDEYAQSDSRIQIIHQENAGVSTARNKGLDEAKGNWICFVDSDDYVSNDYVKEMVNVSIETDIVLMNCFLEKKFPVGTYCGKQIVDAYLSKDVAASSMPFCKLFKRDIILRNNIRFDENIHMGEDALFLLKYLQYCNTISLTECIGSYIYSQTAGSLSSKYYSFESEYECFKKWKELLFKLLAKHKIESMVTERLWINGRLCEIYWRCIQCVHRHKPKYCFTKQVQLLNQLEDTDIDNFCLYNPKQDIRKRICIRLIKQHYFILYCAIAKLDTF